MPEPSGSPSDVFLPLSGSFPGRLVLRQELAPGILDLRFDLEAPGQVSFEPGQFLTMLLPGDADTAAATGAQLKRSYSLASAFSPTTVLRFIVRLVPTGAGSQVIQGLILGRELTFTGPHGFFTLAPSHPGEVIFGATGTGMAALFPMLNALAAEAPPASGQRVVFWGVRREEDLFARDEVEAACAKARADLRIYLSAPPPGWTGGHGRITKPLVDSLPSWTAPTFYLVGNGAMIAETKAELVARGVNRKKQIRTEAFFD